MSDDNRASNVLRGIRSPMRTRTLAGRLSPGNGPAEMLDITDVIGFVGLDVLFTDTNTIDFIYDSGTNKYTADYIGDLGDNADVVITAPADTEVLTYHSASGEWRNVAASGGAADFLSLTDTPANYTGDAGKVPQVNGGETALEFVTPAFSGSVFIGDGRFAPPLAATFPTWVNQQAGVVSDDTFAGFSLFDGSTDTGGDQVIARVKTMPSGAWTATMRIRSQFSGINFNGVGFILRDSALGRNLLCRWFYNSGYKIGFTYYNGNSFNSHVTSGVNWFSDIAWFQIEDDTTNFIFRISVDGVNWFDIGTTLRTSYLTTPDQVGFFVDPENDPGVGINVTYYDDDDDPATTPTVPLALGTLSDVVVPTPTDKDLLQWDNGTSKWVNIAKITYSNIQNVSATDKLLGRSTAGAGVIEEIPLTAAGRALLDDASASAQRTTLGLGTAAVENIGTSGANVPKLDGANTWSAAQTLSDDLIVDTDTLFVDASLDRVGMNTASPDDCRLHMVHDAATGYTWAPNFRTMAIFENSPDAVLSIAASNTGFGEIWFGDVSSQVRARFRQDNTNQEMQFFEKSTVKMVLGNGLRIGVPTGGDKGAGTLNATAVYDDNVLLTCYPLEAYLDGAIDVGAWDARVQNRQHPETRKEIQVLRADYQMMNVEVTDQPAWEEVRTHGPAAAFSEVAERRLDPKMFFEDMVERRALPGMPTKDEWAENGPRSVGETVQTLWEVVETQSIHIKKLLDRIEALEGG